MDFSVTKDTQYYLNLIKDLIVKESGLEYYTNKNDELLDKLIKHKNEMKIKDIQSYYQFISDPSSGGFDELMNNLTIGETYFFRNSEIFKLLQYKVFPDIIERKKSEKVLRIWSAGCSTGEEVYSILILLNEYFNLDLLNWDVKVIGTDINYNFLAKALKGIYKDWSFRELDESFKDKYFTRVGSEYKIKESYKENTFFEYHNLVTNSYPVLTGNLYSFDLIICRNVLIYFNSEHSDKIINKFDECIEDNGYLIIGHSEHNADALKKFDSKVFDDVYYYQKMTGDDTLNIYPKENLNIYSNANTEYLETSYKSDFQEEDIILEEKETESEWHKNLTAFYSNKDFSKFKNECENEIKKNKLNPEPYFFIALFKERQNENSVAEEYLKKAIYLDREMILAHYYMALLLQNRKKTKEATIYFNNVMNLLRRKNTNESFKDFDNITYSQLKKLTEYNLEVIKSL